MVDSVLITRRGIGFVGEMLMGSVSADLFRKCHGIPLWIIDGEVTSKNILVAVDGSCHSLMAVDHLAHILSGIADVRIFLYHSLRLFQTKVEKRELLHPKWRTGVIPIRPGKMPSMVHHAGSCARPTFRITRSLSCLRQPILTKAAAS
jgi:nucleotide-binding universal stress UspA family protein